MGKGKTKCVFTENSSAQPRAVIEAVYFAIRPTQYKRDEVNQRESDLF